MNKDLLEIEVRLLIYKYGYKNILSILANIKESSIEEIESLLASMAQRGKPTKNKKQKSILEVAEDIIKKSEHYEALKKLAIGYNNKNFLPQLKDVKQFLERSGIDANKIKTRVLATKKVFELLITFNLDELEEIIPFLKENEESAFSALSREIIGVQTNSTKQSNITNTKKLHG